MTINREGPMIYGYARVSTGSQDYQSQVDKLRSAGATKTYREKISGSPVRPTGAPTSDQEPSAR